MGSDSGDGDRKCLGPGLYSAMKSLPAATLALSLGLTLSVSGELSEHPSTGGLSLSPHGTGGKLRLGLCPVPIVS